MNNLFTLHSKSVDLYSPTAAPMASTFLWNRQQLLQINCRGYVKAIHMSPEPACYSYGPNIEASTFMQPEQGFFTHHPGRFFYIKDRDSAELFSVPYEPVREKADRFVFSAGLHGASWTVLQNGIQIELSVELGDTEAIELWTLNIKNSSEKPRRLSAYPCFSVGYMSWMNQSASYVPELEGIVANSVRPYQKLEDYNRVLQLKDKTFFLCDQSPLSWDANWATFEGEGGLHRPSSVLCENLGNSEAHYETPIAAVQYKMDLAPGESRDYRFLFGPAQNHDEIASLRRKYFSLNGFERAQKYHQERLGKVSSSFNFQTNDSVFNSFFSEWIPRQVFYHGDTNRFTTDPQTRNYLQDNMGMVFVDENVSREAFVKTLQQQEPSGALPDGVLLRSDSELKYINQIPHSDHCLWLPLCLHAYLRESNDYHFLEQIIVAGDGSSASVFDRCNKAMEYLIADRDFRGLSYIAQGDWCDPMNMVGPAGKGVSGWLSIALIYVSKCWSEICAQRGDNLLVDRYLSLAAALSSSVNKHLWSGQWYARGITDDNRMFGVQSDREGRIYLNPQSWALLAGCADEARCTSLLNAIDEYLDSAHGPQMLAPAYTRVQDDVGRLTQKFPGSAENGSIYNHAAAFYIYSLYQIGEWDKAYQVLMKLVPGGSEESLLRSGQFPVFIANYYRGAVHQFPRTAGKSSQLINTGTASWLLRIVIEELFGTVGCREGLKITPKFPREWSSAHCVRRFRGAELGVYYKREESMSGLSIEVNGELIKGNIITAITPGEHYRVDVKIGCE